MNHPSRNPYNKILTFCILLLFSVYGKTFAYTEKLRIPPKSDIVREILVYDNNYQKLSNKFKNNAFGRYGTYYSNLLSEDEDIYPLRNLAMAYVYTVLLFRKTSLPVCLEQNNNSVHQQIFSKYSSPF